MSKELKVTDFSSKGRVTRIANKKAVGNKIVNLQSDGQLRAFLLLEYSKEVVSIKVNSLLEQVEEKLSNIDNLNLERFRDKETGNLYKMYTNFLVTLKSDRVVAIAYKPSQELNRKEVIEKLEIEKRYWEMSRIEFCIITEKEIDKTLVKNIAWVRDITGYSLKNKEELAEKLYYYIQENKDEVVIHALNKFEKIEEIKEGTAVFLFRYLIAKEEIYVDMKKNINLSEKINKLVVF